ncbi:hypothetical protein B7939_13735, partial [Eggerthia catenaformis]
EQGAGGHEQVLEHGSPLVMRTTALRRSSRTTPTARPRHGAGRGRAGRKGRKSGELERHGSS